MKTLVMPESDAYPEPYVHLSYGPEPCPCTSPPRRADRSSQPLMDPADPKDMWCAEGPVSVPKWNEVPMPWSFSPNSTMAL